MDLGRVSHVENVVDLEMIVPVEAVRVNEDASALDVVLSDMANAG